MRSLPKTRTAECKIWFVYGDEEFYGSFDQDFIICPAEPDVGINNPYIQWDSDPKDLWIFDDEDTLCVKNSGEYPALLAAFQTAYTASLTNGKLEDQIAESFHPMEDPEDA